MNNNLMQIQNDLEILLQLNIDVSAKLCIFTH